MKKLPFITPEIATKYSDLSGLIEIDWEGRIANLHNLCNQYQINMSQYFLIGFGFLAFNEQSVTCQVLLLDKDRYGETFSEIEQNIAEIETVEAIQKKIEIPYSDLSKYIKHIDALLLTSIGVEIKNISIQSE